MKFNKLLRDKDSMLSIACIVLGIIIILYSQTFSAGVAERFRTDEFGPSLYPSILGGATALIGVCMLISIIVKEKKRKGSEDLNMTEEQTVEESPKAEALPLTQRMGFRITMIFAFLFLYWAGATLIGYLIPTILFSVITMTQLEGKTWKKLLSAVVLALILYVIFRYALQVPISRGILLN